MCDEHCGPPSAREQIITFALTLGIAFVVVVAILGVVKLTEDDVPKPAIATQEEPCLSCGV